MSRLQISILPRDGDNNPLISIIKVWEAYAVASINLCNEFTKVVMDMIKR